MYAYQQPRIDLVAGVLDLAGLTGQETIADIGCGNGIYLAGLARRGHAGRLLGVDLSPGMLAATRATAPDAGLLVGDAAALPLADGVTDVSLAPHMLYHVPDRQAAARELRRITRPGGQLLVVLNGADHLAQLRDLVMAAAADAGWPPEEIASEYQTHQVMTLDAGAQLLAGTFARCSGMTLPPSSRCLTRSRLPTTRPACGLPRPGPNRPPSAPPWPSVCRSGRTASSASRPTPAC